MKGRGFHELSMPGGGPGLVGKMRSLSERIMSLPRLLNTYVYINIMLNMMIMQLCRDEPVYTPDP